VHSNAPGFFLIMDLEKSGFWEGHQFINSSIPLIPALFVGWESGKLNRFL